ncbi:MFS transporter, partial [Candidatus Bathyarchaeota archaeon]|nr:MFS transporter [Candidatus Bathyarchaeota archaeon]
MGAYMERNFWMICITHMFLEVFLFVQVALIPVYIREFQLSILEASLVATIPSLVQLSMNIPSGYLADRFQSRHLLFASMMMEGISAILVSQTRSFWTLVLGVSILRISSPLYHISGLSGISRFVSPGRMNRSMGFHNALGSFGSTMGLLSLSLSLSPSTLAWRSTYLVWSIPILAWGLVILKYLREGKDGEGFRDGYSKREVIERNSQRTLKNRGAEFGREAEKEGRRKNGRIRGPSRIFTVLSSTFIFFLAVLGIREMGITGASTFMTTYFVKIRGLSESSASLLYSLGPVVGIVGSLIGGYVGERAGEKRALSLAFLGSALSLSLMVLLPFNNLAFITIPYIIYSFFNN